MFMFSTPPPITLEEPGDLRTLKRIFTGTLYCKEILSSLGSFIKMKDFRNLSVTGTPHLL